MGGGEKITLPAGRVTNASSSSADFLAGIGTLRLTQVAGFHRAGPSTTLDKALSNCETDYSRKHPIVKDYLRKIAAVQGGR